MIQSMTAFARSEQRGEWGSATCEIRSINHRYLEIGLHLPEVLRVLEMPLRESIRQHLNRGKIECNIRYQPALAAKLFAVNESLAKEICLASDVVSKFLINPAPVSSVAILQWPGVLETKETNFEIIQAEITQLINATLLDLVSAREREGEGLKHLFLERLDLMQAELAKIRNRLPQIKKEQNDKLVKRFTDAKMDLNQDRLEQEMVLFLQKIDIAEELDRTETHITEIKRILTQGGSIGRRFDFLLQELNREANTLGSKSTDTETTHSAVELKVLIEQIREQVQNIE